ncbi:Bromodomain adjacent to zinc finger domain protein 1A [Trichinella papuae]|uniref:Bromodomain adjacent to zinc finger domain protein 1A n=1 Tax=Trichinella papuae TaxID=268474 RepID=A0A0V1M5C2_9BILA|nr:Bromodomain adjacent to zinc finger domain protein 1A [Trichinella papuae]
MCFAEKTLPDELIISIINKLFRCLRLRTFSENCFNIVQLLSMPLLQGEPLRFVPRPADLHPDEKVFYCPCTKEVFREFEQYFKRTMILNSLVWTCAATGDEGLTYEAALKSEHAVCAPPDNIAEELVKAILFLVKLTAKVRLCDVVGMIHSFISTHVFVGETAHFVDNAGNRRTGVVRSVTVPETVNKSDDNLETPSSPSENANKLNGSKNLIGAKGSAAVYVVEFSIDDAANESLTGNTLLCCVDESKVFRKRPLSKEECYALLRAYCCTSQENIWVVKDDIAERHEVSKLEWDKIYGGPLPDLSIYKSCNEQAPSESDESEDDAEDLGEEFAHGGKHNKALTLMWTEVEKYQVDIGAELKERISKGFAVTEMDIRNIRALIKKAKQQCRIQKRENRKRQRKNNPKCRKVRDDLLFNDDDQAEFPTLAAVNFPKHVSPARFGDYLSLLDFLHQHGNRIQLRDYFPDGVTLSMLYKATLDCSPEGIFAELLCYLLTVLFERQCEEDGDDVKILKSEEIAMLDSAEIEYKFYLPKMEKATEMFKEMRNTHGVSVYRLPVDGYTLSEVVRIYFQSSGHFTGCRNGRFRNLHRGSFKSYDDQAFNFSIKRPELIESLRRVSVYELKPDDRLDLLLVLRDQLLTFQLFRDLLDTSSERVRSIRLDLLRQKVPNGSVEREMICFLKSTLRCGERSRAGSKQQQQQQIDGVDEQQHQLNSLLRKFQSFVDRPLSDDLDLSDFVEPLTSVRLDELESVEQIELVRKLRRHLFNQLYRSALFDLFELQSTIGMTLLGQDRSYRRYYFVRSVGAVLVENVFELDFDNAERCSDRVVVVAAAASFEQQPLVPRWQMLRDLDTLNALLNSLNRRGEREAELAANLLLFKGQLVQMFASFDDTLNNAEAEPLLELELEPVDSKLLIERSFRLSLLDFENRLFYSRMQTAPIADRQRWREQLEGEQQRLEVKHLAQILIDLVNTIDCKFMENFSTRPVKKFHCTTAATTTSSSSSASADDSVQCNSVVDGQSTDSEKTTCLNLWKQSLDSCFSYSSLHLHLLTLDKQLTWQKSILNMRCRKCRRKGDMNNLAICSDCGRAVHLGCSKPCLQTLPTEDDGWICFLCKKQQNWNAKKAAIVEEEAFDEEEEEATTAEAEERSHQKQEQEKLKVQQKSETYSICSNCTTVIRHIKQRIHCSSCTLSFHTRCVGVKKSEIAVASWLCKNCNPKISNGINGKNLQMKLSRSGRPLRGYISPVASSFIGSPNGIIAQPDSCDSNGLTQKRKAKNNGRLKKRTINKRRAEQSDVETRCNTCISRLVEHPDAWPFLKPVSRREAPDYYDIIEQPMDLRTIQMRLLRHEYSSVSEMVRDAQLMFSNCRQYNEAETEVYACGERLSKFCQQQLEHLKLRDHEKLNVRKRRRAAF